MLLVSFLNYIPLQEYLKEEPYTAEEIEKITSKSLDLIFADSASSLDVIKAAKYYKLFQVCLLIYSFIGSSLVNYYLFFLVVFCAESLMNVVRNNTWAGIMYTSYNVFLCCKYLSQNSHVLLVFHFVIVGAFGLMFTTFVLSESFSRVLWSEACICFQGCGVIKFWVSSRFLGSKLHKKHVFICFL